jgi:hypothetical protein
MALRLSDLPPKLRAQVLEQAGEKPSSKASRAGTGTGEPCPGTCQCGEEFGSASKWERHSKGAGAGHRRWTITL